MICKCCTSQQHCSDKFALCLPYLSISSPLSPSGMPRAPAACRSSWGLHPGVWSRERASPAAVTWPGQNAAAAAGLAPAVCLSKRRQKPRSRERERMGVNASSYPHSCSPRFGGNSQTQHTFIGKWLTTALCLSHLGAGGRLRSAAHLQLKVVRKWAWLIWLIS